LFLEENSTIIGTTNLDLYNGYIPRSEDINHLSKVNLPARVLWYRALIIMDHAENVALTGTGTIDASNLVDPKGEENRRGPHGILIADSKNITISNIRVTRAGDYNIMCLYVENITFMNLTIAEGYDGIHIRSGENIIIENCKFYTLDDAIAGGYWEKTLITDCLINSSCNGVRIIMPVKNLEIRNCEISGPGLFGHFRGKPVHPYVTNSLTAIILQPGAWGLSKGDVDSAYIHDIRIRDMNTALTFVLNEGNQSNAILVERIIATGINLAACSVEAWPEGSIHSNIKFKDISIRYLGKDNPAVKSIKIARPRTESRILPYWGWYIHNVENIEFENVSLDYVGNEVRPVMCFENVRNVLFNNLTYKKVPDIEQMKFINVKNIKTIPSAGLQ
jgi:polygalacturonase